MVQVAQFGRQTIYAGEAPRSFGLLTVISELEKQIHELLILRKGALADSKGIRGKSDSLRLTCQQGHVWTAVAHKVLSGKWCPVCAGRVVTLDAMYAIAERKKGKCLSSCYVNLTTPLEWECRRGHRWMSTPENVKHGNWCTECTKLERQEYWLPKIKAEVERRGGKLLSTSYRNNHEKLKAICQKGHAFTFTKKSLLDIGSWCRRCKCDAMMNTLEDMQRLAAKRGGECLSTEYQGVRHKLVWSCAEGHKWETTPTRIQLGHWCPQCGGTGKKSLEDAIELAKSRGGKCLSQKYVNAQVDLKWECAEGHRWQAGWSEVRSGNWCAECSGMKPHTIQDMKAFAKAHGGECLSRSYKSNKDLLVWHCSNGHEFAEAYNHISSRTYWCCECLGSDRVKVIPIRSREKMKQNKL